LKNPLILTHLTHSRRDNHGGACQIAPKVKNTGFENSNPATSENIQYYFLKAKKLDYFLYL